MDFILFPAIDLHRGRCVRLQQGRLQAETVYSEDPVATAHHWIEQGAEWLHVVNLDGAFQTDRTEREKERLPLNLRTLGSIADAVSVPIQFGGGIRKLGDIELALKLGATRVVLGTVAVKNPELVRQAIRRYGNERIVVGLDARDGKVATHGWVEQSQVTVEELGKKMREIGVRYAVYTDIRRDGMLTGVDVHGAIRLAQATGLQVIASGGVADLDDVRRLTNAVTAGVIGAIIGQALYAERIDLTEALHTVKDILAHMHGQQ